MAVISMLNFRLISWIILLGGLLTNSVFAYQPAPDAYAATLTIMQEGVTLRRAGTQAWLPLRVGAVMPLGEGDQLQTAAGGRALVEFWPGGNMLLLPYSTYKQGLLTAAEAGSDHQIAGRLDGAAIHRFSSPVAAYRLELNDGVIVQPASQFATWSRSTGPDAVTVYEGVVRLEANEIQVAIGENHGWYAGEAPVLLDDALNAAALIALYEGCEGVVSIDLRSLRVREGPGEGYVVIGYFNNGDRVSVMGVNQSNGWYRVRSDSHFGWVQALAVQAACDNLPRSADTTRELFVQAAGATALEREWLRPYFGLPVDDLWFYRP